MSLAVGSRLGPYEVDAPLGAGGMGEVYTEARVIMALNHPHICTLHDVGHHDGIDFLVMEYVEGQTLAERLEKGALPIEQVLPCAVQIAEALDAAHRHGIVHRDLKPANVMLTKCGVKLLEFGLAKSGPVGAVAGMSLPVTMPSPLTRQGTILGTLHYMSPEQVETKTRTRAATSSRSARSSTRWRPEARLRRAQRGQPKARGAHPPHVASLMTDRLPVHQYHQFGVRAGCHAHQETLTVGRHRVPVRFV